MASNIGYRQFPEFDVRNDPEMVYAHFVKYASKIANLRLQSEQSTSERGSFRLVSRSGLRCLFIGPLLCDQSFFRCSFRLARKSNQSGLSKSKKRLAKRHAT